MLLLKAACFSREGSFTENFVISCKILYLQFTVAHKVVTSF